MKEKEQLYRFQCPRKHQAEAKIPNETVVLRLVLTLL